MRDSVNKKVYIIFGWILFSAVFLTVSSYAWLSANRIFGVQTFNIHIASQGDLEISVDAINWKGVLALADIIEARNTYSRSVNQIPRTLRPVSSGGIVENGFLQLFYGELLGAADGGYILTSERTIEEEGFGEDSTGIFVVFDVFLRTNYDANLFITPASVIASLEDESPGIENAFRVAFLNQGTLPLNADANEIQNLRDADRAYIWEPNYDRHTASAVDHARETYGIITTQFNAPRINYDGIIREFGYNARVREGQANVRFHPDKFRRVNVDVATRHNFSSDAEIFPLPTGITKVRIYIWIEGQDVDCEINASVGEVLINLQLSTEQPGEVR